MATKKQLERFVRLSSTGRELSLRTKNWPLVLDRQTKLIWTAQPVQATPTAWADAVAAADAVQMMGRKFHAPSIKEQLTIVDYLKRDPAVDTRFFRIPSAWFWTRTPLAGFEGSHAWDVHFYDGDALSYRQSTAGFVLAVCSARASQ